MRQLITHIGRLWGFSSARPALRGGELAQLPWQENAWLTVENGKVLATGSMADCPERADQTHDAHGDWLWPAYCDSHTHLVYPTPRSTEFVLRIQGATYEEIAAQGGGILNTAKAMAATTEDELVDSALPRVEKIARMGTGAVEIKSGYGLSLDGELKMLRAIRRLAGQSPLTIKSTFLGAHAFPAEYKQNREAYISLLLNEALPAIAAEGLADYCDVFCDRGFFTPEETTRILEAAARHNLAAKVHANELGHTGGVQAAVAAEAVSADHLEHLNAEEIALLAGSSTLATLLPGTAFFLKLPWAPAGELITAGAGVVLASDFNPGSCPSGNMNLMQSLACLYLKMLPEEAYNACTLNGAWAMGLQNTHGWLGPGAVASFFLTPALQGVAELPYYLGNPPIKKVWVRGTQV